MSTLISPVSTKYTGLAVTYQGRQISSLNLVRIMFWNGGRDSITNQVVPLLDPIRFTVEGEADVLSARLIASARDSIGARVHQNQKTIRLEFDNLDYRDGCLLEVFCDGNIKSIECEGKVLGAKQIKRTDIEPFKVHETAEAYRIKINRESIVAGVASFSVLAWFTVYLPYSAIQKVDNPYGLAFAYGVLALGSIVALWGAYWFLFRLFVAPSHLKKVTQQPVSAPELNNIGSQEHTDARPRSRRTRPKASEEA